MASRKFQQTGPARHWPAPVSRRIAGATLIVLIFAALSVSTVAHGEPPEGAVDAVDAAELKSLWIALGSENEDEAAAAIATLAKAPAKTVELAEQHLAVVAKNGGAGAGALIKALNDDEYLTRVSAQQKLAALGRLVEPQLRRALESKPTVEVRWRVQALLDGMPDLLTRSADDRRWVRLAQLLKATDAPAAQVLRELLAPAANLTIADPRVPRLCELLASTIPEDRVSGALQLIDLGDTGLAALPKLIALLAADGPHVPVGNISRSVGAHVEAALPALGSPAVRKLTEGLASPNPQVRTRVANVLGQIQDERAIEPLIAALADRENGEVRSALVKFGTKATGLLLKQLDSNDSTVRSNAAYVLGQVGERQAIEPLAKLLADDDKIVRRNAIDALGHFHAAAVDALISALKSDQPNIRGDEELRYLITSTLASIQDPRVADQLIALAGDGQETVRAAAISFLVHRAKELPEARLVEIISGAMQDPSNRVKAAATGALGYLSHYHLTIDASRVADLLLSALDEPDENVRRAAIQSLGSWRSGKAVDRLLPFLDDKQLLGFAAGSLGQIGDARAIAPLRRHLGEKNPHVILALGRLHDRKSTEMILTCLTDADEQVRDAAIDSLGEARDRRAVLPLIAALDAENGKSLHRLAHALGELKDPRAVQPLIEAARRSVDYAQFRFNPPAIDSDPIHHPVTWPLHHIGLPAVEPLAAALHDRSDKVRGIAAWVLANLASQGGLDAEDMQPAVEPLVAALLDPSPLVRDHAAVALGILRDPRAADALIAALAAETPSYLHRNAAIYLGGLRDPKSFEPLVTRLADERAETRAAAAIALGLSEDPRAAEPLLTALGDSNPNVRADAALALAEIKAAKAVEPLIALLADKHAHARRAAAESLGRLADPHAAEALARAGDDEQFAVRIAAGLALLRLDDPRGLAIITRCLGDESGQRREEAITAVSMSWIKNESLVAPLSKALGDPSSTVRLYAAGALGRVGNAAAVEALLARLDDRTNLRAVLQGLAATKSERGLRAVIDHLNDPQPEIRSVVAYAIANLDDQRHAPLLIGRLADPSPEVRLAAVRALTMLKSSEAVESLTAALADDNPDVAIYAARALKRINK